MTGFCLNRKIIRVIGIILSCLFCVLLCACNHSDAQKQVSETEKPLHQLGIAYDADTLTMCVIVSLSGKEDNKLDSNVKWISTKYAPNSMYKCEDVDIVVDVPSLLEELENRLTQEQWMHEGVKYNALKIELRYDTIYKSIKSDANVTKSENRYIHKFKVDETLSEQTFSLQLTNQNSASWYTVLIVAVLVFGVIIVVIALALKGKLWQKKRK